VIDWNQVEAGYLRDQLEKEECIVWEGQVEQSHQHDQLEGVDSAPEHLDRGGTKLIKSFKLTEECSK
jgi:hypothetical protein